MTPWTVVHQASLSITNSQSLLKLMSIELMMPFNRLILCRPLLLPSIFPSIRVFYKALALHIRWPKYWRFSCSISPSNEYSGLISFRKSTGLVWDKLSLQKLNKGTLVYSQAEGQGLPGLPLSMIIITKAMESKSKKLLQCGVKIGFFPASVTPGSRRGARAHLLKLFAGDLGTYCLLSTGQSLLMLSTLKNKKVKVKLLSRVRLFATRGLYCSPPNSSVHGILQARILEWVAISFSRGSSRPRDLSRECMFLGSLSRHNKDLEQQTLKPSARHSSRVLDKPCYSS